MSLNPLTSALSSIPDGTVVSLSHEDIGTFINQINVFLNQLGVGIHEHPSYFNNLYIRADGTSITADFVPGGRLVDVGSKEAKFAIGCNGKGAATQKGTAEFFSKHSVSLGTSENYELRINGNSAKLYHGEEQVWIGEAKGAHGLDGTYNLKF